MFVRGEGIVASEPSVVAIDTDSGAVHAVGEDAQRMIGRTPARISAVRPLRHGVIADFEVTEKMLRHFMARAHGSRRARPRVMMCAPSGITDVERRALMEACVAAGARSVHLIEESLAAAIGAGLAIDEPRANMVVDVGGGTSEVAVISLGGIVVSRSLRVGGYDLDDTVAAWLRNTHGLAIGETTAERVKLEVGQRGTRTTSDGASASAGAIRCRACPAQVDVTSEEMRAALEDPVAGDRGRGEGGAGDDPAGAGLGHLRARHPGGRRRRAAARPPRAARAGDQRRRCGSPTTRSPAWRSGAGQALDEIELLERRT